jgi:hypothetical protein
MFGFGKKEADSGALYSALIYMTYAHYQLYGELISEEKLFVDAKSMLREFNAKVKDEHVKPLIFGAFIISKGTENLLEDLKKIGRNGTLTNENLELIAQKLKRHGVTFD